MRRLTNSRDRFVLPRSILLLFLSPFFFISFSRFSTKSQAQGFVAPLPPGEMSSLRSRGAQSKSSLYPFLYKLGSATRFRNRRLRMAPELDKILLRKNACRVSDVHLHVRLPFSLYGPHEALSLLDPPPPCDLDSIGVYLVGVNLAKAESARPQE